MTVLKRYVLRAATLATVLVVLSFGSLFFVAQSAYFKQRLEAELGARTGYDFVLGEISFRPPFNLIADDVTVARGSDSLLSSARVVVILNPLDFFSRTIHRLTLHRPLLHLSLEELAQPSAQIPAAVAVRHLIVEDGSLILQSEGRTAAEFSPLHLQAQNLNVGDTGELSLRADLPHLGAEVQLSLKQRQWEKDIDMVLRPRSSDYPGGAKKEAAETLRLQGKLTTMPGARPTVTLAGKFADLAIGQTTFSGELSAHAVPNANFTEADVSAQFAIADFPNSIKLTGWTALSDTAVGTFSGNLSMVEKLLTLTAFKLESPVGVAEGGGTFHADAGLRAESGWITLRRVPWQMVRQLLPEPFNGWAYGGTGDAELRFQGPWRTLQIDGTIAGTAVKISGPGLAIDSLALRAPISWSSAGIVLKDTSLKARDLSFSSRPGWQSGAERLEIEGSLSYSADRSLPIQARIQLAGGRFSSSDNAKVGEGLAAAGAIDLIFDAARESTRLTGRLSLARGETLWGKFFLDLGEHSPVLQFDGDYLSQADSIALRHTELALASAGTLIATGSVDSLSRAPAVDLAVRGDNLDAGRFFDKLVRETYKQSYPLLENLAVAGRVGLQIHARGSLERLGAAGRLTLQGGDVRARSGDWQVGPLALTLPFEINDPIGAARGSPGILSIRGGRLAGQTLAPLAASVSLVHNKLTFHQPLKLMIFGGSLEIGDLQWPDIISDPKEFSLALEARDLDLQELTGALGWHRFNGVLSGSIPQVRSSGDTLRSEGRIQVDLFGGQLHINRMEIENLFSALPTMRLDARFQDIRLEQASETFAFGRISGILEGSIKNLVITDKQPARFEADVRTVARSGVGQWISVEALNQITVLSSGQEAAPLYGGLAGLFENFRYSQLGFRASLRNDKLVLRGVESRDNQEFLVVGSLLPPTVNIISHTQEIGFSELLRRVARIQSEKVQSK